MPHTQGPGLPHGPVDWSRTGRREKASESSLPDLTILAGADGGAGMGCQDHSVRPTESKQARGRQDLRVALQISPSLLRLMAGQAREGPASWSYRQGPSSPEGEGLPDQSGLPDLTFLTGADGQAGWGGHGLLVLMTYAQQAAGRRDLTAAT